MMYSANVKDSENADRWLAALFYSIVHIGFGLSKANHNFHYNYKHPELPLKSLNWGAWGTVPLPDDRRLNAVRHSVFHAEFGWNDHREETPHFV